MPKRIQPSLRVDDLREGRMIIKFVEYDTQLRQKVGKVPGARFVSEAKGGPGWTIQKDMQTCSELKRLFGDQISFSEEIKEWGRIQREKEAELLSIAGSSTATEDLSVLREKLQGRTYYDIESGEERPIWEAFREDQKVGVQFLNRCPNPLLADEPGLGKTWQVIGAIMQAGKEEGYNLVICPKISIENVWLRELTKFQDEVVFVAPEGRRQREKLLKEVQLCLEDEAPFWLVVNPAMVSLRRTEQEGDVDFYDHQTESYLKVQFPFLFEVHWDNIIIDESHLSGLPNPNSQFSRAMRMMNCDKRIAVSGTPMGGKPERLWGTLHWLEPGDFTSKHTWLKRWSKEKILHLQDGRTVRTYEGLKGSLEEEFYNAHSKYMLRRKKEDVGMALNHKTFIDVWVDFADSKHKKQYELMDSEAVAKLMQDEEEVGRISMANVLATNTWLKQFANSFCDLEERERIWNDFIQGWEIKYKAIPTRTCPKLEALWEIIQEHGVDDPEAGKQIVVFSQFAMMARMVSEWLIDKKLNVGFISGAVTSRTKREQLISDFQAGGKLQVMVMTTKAGGVSINLDRADTCVFMDETYDPDDQSQGWGRIDRASRSRPITIYSIRTKDTIEHDVLDKLRKKQALNDILMDRYRQAKERAGK